MGRKQIWTKSTAQILTTFSETDTSYHWTQHQGFPPPTNSYCAANFLFIMAEALSVPSALRRLMKMWHGQTGSPKRLSCWRVSQQPGINVNTCSGVWEGTTPSSHSVTGDNQVRLCTAQLINWFSYKSMAGKLVHTVYHRINTVRCHRSEA